MLKVAPLIQLRDLGGTVKVPSAGGRGAARGRGEENDICSHQTLSLGSKYTKNVFAVGCIWNTGERACWPQMWSYFC